MKFDIHFLSTCVLLSVTLLSLVFAAPVIALGLIITAHLVYIVSALSFVGSSALCMSPDRFSLPCVALLLVFPRVDH